MTFELTLKCYGGAELRPFLESLQDRGGAPGWELVQAIPRADNVYAADRLLRELESEEWLVRGKLCPSTSQMFFDVNHEMRRGNQPSGFFWMPGPKLADGLKDMG